MKILVYYFEEDKAFIVQSTFASLIELIETNINEIWKKDTTQQGNVSTFGPHATVQTILAQRSNMANNNGNKGIYQSQLIQTMES